MSITNKLTAGLVSFAVIFSVSIVPATTVTATAQGIEELQQELHRLQAQYNALTASSTTSSSSVCPYTWTRNLSTGSTGEDVRQLQRFLNGNPQTIVASSGVGSSGNESSYYGPATARAVSKFQEVHAAQILTPLGLTKGTGGFYSSTRSYANSLCRSGTSISGPRDQDPIVSVTGDSLAVTPGSQIGDGYAVLGAQRVPYTSFVLTAGNDDVRLEGVRVKKFGLSGSDNFESVALVDSNGVQIGSSRSLNSRDEARLGGNFVIPRNRSVTLAIVGNVVGSGAEASGIAGLEVIGVDANARVQGNFPIRGAAHVFSDAVTLQQVNVTVTDGDSEVQLNEETEVAVFTFDLDATDADEEDSYLRSVTFEQRGSADRREMGDVTVYVDDDRADYSLTVFEDQYTVSFDGRGVLIEEGDSIDVSLEVETNTGSKEDIEFALDDSSNVYIVGANYGYGLPVVLKDSNGDAVGNIKVATPSVIQSGNIESGGRLRSTEFDDEVQYGRDVVIGAHSVEFEGEDVDMEGLTFNVALSGYGDVDLTTDAESSSWRDADEDSITIDNIRLVVDGEVVAFGDLVDSNGNQAEFDEPATACSPSTTACANIELQIEFDDAFTIDVRDNREVIFEVVTNLDRSWANFDGAELDLELASVEMAEGRISEKDYTESPAYFASVLSFEGVEIVGNQIDFEVTNSGVDDSTYVAGTEDVVFGSFEVDASEAIDDITVKNIWVAFEAVGVATPLVVADLDHLSGCAVYDESDDRIADGRDSLSGVTDATNVTVTDQLRFRFRNGIVVDAGDEAEFQIRCDIDDDAATDAAFKLIETTDNAFEYLVADDKFKDTLTGGSEKIAIASSGSLIVTVNHPDDNQALYAQAVGSSGVDDVDVVEVEFEAEEEDIRVTDIYLSGIKVSTADATEASLSEVIDSMHVGLGSTSVRPRHFESTLTIAGDPFGGNRDNVLRFKNVNEVIEVGRSGSQTFNLSVDYGGITENKGTAGSWIDGTNLVVAWEGVTSDTSGVTVTPLTSNFTAVRVFPTVPTISADSRDQTHTNGAGRKLYEFSVRADSEGDVYLKQVALNIDASAVSLTDVTVRRGTQLSSKSVGTVSGTISSNAKQTVTFGNVEIIDAGETVTYSVFATVSGLADNESITVDLAADSTAPASADAAGGKAFAASLGNFVWSPNTLDRRSDTAATNTDWFNGYAVFTDDDAGPWSTSN